MIGTKPAYKRLGLWTEARGQKTNKQTYLYNVTNSQLANLNLLRQSISDNIKCLFAFNSVLETTKLFLLGPIIEGCDNDNNDDCNEDGEAFDVSVFIFFLRREP